MLREKAKRVRRKLRALNRVGWTPVSPIRRTRRSVNAVRAPSKALAETALAITTAGMAAVAGFELCARKTRDETIAVAAKSAAEFLRGLVDSTIEAAAAYGLDASPHARTGDRLRWEWLASTAAVVDGSPDARLLSECSRILTEMMVAVAPHADELDSGLGARLRVASAEAYSLASAVRYQRRGELVFALT
jgi:hypothetical protein